MNFPYGYNFFLQYLQFLKELGSELRLSFFRDFSATPQNDVEFFMDSTLRSEWQESFSTTLEITGLGSEWWENVVNLAKAINFIRLISWAKAHPYS